MYVYIYKYIQVIDVCAIAINDKRGHGFKKEEIIWEGLEEERKGENVICYIIFTKRREN